MFDTALWLGTQETCEFALKASAQAVQMVMGGRRTAEADLPELLSLSGSVGVVSIRGGLVPGNAGFMRYFGVVGYSDIREALVAAVNHPEVKSIVLDINSGGGAVAGVADTARFITKIDSLKPVVTYADGAMASGAYWLGSSARQVLASETTIAGSIGVIMTHTEVSRMRDQAGLTDTVIRAGEYKALASPYQPLTDVAKAELQAQADQIYTVFGNWVAKRRKVPYSKMDAQMGQGREFIGQRAVDAGLVDKVGTFEDAIAIAKQLGSVDNKKTITQNSRQTYGANSMPKATLTAAQIAVLESGGSLETGVNSDAELTDEQRTAAEAQAATEAQAAAEAETARLAAEAEAARVATEAAAAGSESETVKFLRGELASANSQLIAEKVQTATLQAQVAATSATHDALVEIARNAVGKMNVALGGNAEGAKTLSAAEVVTEHTRVSAVFNAKFKVGGVAASSTIEVERKPQPIKDVRSPLLRAVVNSVK